ncbi:MAG TPA: sulfatase-like hydrolase/transferase [Anaerolineales bacterium]
MNPKELTRRDFLKMSALTALAGMALPALDFKPSSVPQKQAGVENLPNILIVVFDTFSAKHLSLLGYKRDTTPNLARFANRANVYHHHYAGGNFTMPGTASLLTGTYPWSHRGLHLFGTVAEPYVNRNLFSVLSEDYYCSVFTHNAIVMGIFNQLKDHIDQVTLPKDLAILSQPLTERILPNDFALSFWGERVIRGSGADLPGSLFLSFIGEDFDSFTPEALKREYADLFPRGLPNNTVGTFFLLEHAIDWIQKQALELPRPFLGYYHLFPPHEPYQTRREFVDIFNDAWKPESKPVRAFPQGKSEEFLDEKRRHYDEYIAFVDAEFGRLYNQLERSGILDNTYFIVTSDHGQLFEREIHGHVTSTLYEPIIHIPLLISKPGQKERHDIITPTSCADLLPTLTHIAGKEVPDRCEGQLLPGFGDPNPDTGDRAIYAIEAKQNPQMDPLNLGTIAMIREDFKLIHYTGFAAHPDDYELYDLDNDPEEMADLYKTKKGLASELRGAMIAKLDRVNHPFERG